MDGQPKYPWRIDTNDRYRELIATVLNLSTAALLLPVFLAREFLGVPSDIALKDIFSSTAYWSWALLGISIFAGISFHFLSAKWARLAWQQPVSLFKVPASDKCIELALECSLWLAILGFLGGVFLTLLFLITYTPSP